MIDQDILDYILERRSLSFEQYMTEDPPGARTFEEIAAYLNKEKFPTPSGRGRWHKQSVHRALDKHFSRR